MFWHMMEPRSDDWYEESDRYPDQSHFDWSQVLLFPIYLVLAPIFFVVLALVSGLFTGGLLLASVYSEIKGGVKDIRVTKELFVGAGLLFAAILAFVCLHRCLGTSTPTPPPSSVPTDTSTPSFVASVPPTNTWTPSPVPTVAPTRLYHSFEILVDDFAPQPLSGADAYFYNRLGGDRGAINDSRLTWGRGVVTTTLRSGRSWGGAWMSLNHPIREAIPIDASALLPTQIRPAYQSQITGIAVDVRDGTPGRTLKLELKGQGAARWVGQFDLHGGPQAVRADLPPLGQINEFVWVLDRASAGDSVEIGRVSLTATTQITDTAIQAFVWSYGMLLNNWDPATGLVRDKSREASGEFDAIQATGGLAAATAMAEQLGIVSHADAVHLVSTISDTLLLDLPRFHGLWPHWVRASPGGGLEIVPETEWSSVDTTIAALGLLAAQHGLGLDTSGTEEMLQEVDWADLVTAEGLSHGYSYQGDLLPYAWDAFGGENWLIELAYAAATGQVAPLAYPCPPTANGSGFIDELAWLFVPPPSEPDRWGTDWASYRAQAAGDQIAYYPAHYPRSCLSQLGLFGLSAAEVPVPSAAAQDEIYQAFGVGGRFAEANDGSMLLGAPVVAPHYAAMVASLRPVEAVGMWGWLIENGFLTPLNNVESLIFPQGSDCDAAAAQWNHLKGSWNLALQTLGWGRYLAQREGLVPVLWQATNESPFLQRGYSLLVPDGSSGARVDPHLIPGRIEAEAYGVCGADISYYDTTPGNEGGQYRSDDVDIEGTTDVGGGHDVGWIDEGEWLAYKVEVQASGLYDIQARVASALNRTVNETLPAAGTVRWTVPLTRAFHVEWDGEDVSGPMTFVATGGWQHWTSVYARRVFLTAGRHTIRLVLDSGGMNLNWVSFAPSRSPDEPVEETIDRLIAQMTTSEKIAQLHGIDWMDTPDNLRLGIPGFRMADGPHGLRGGPSNSFPVGIAMAATWDPELIERVGRAMGREFLARGRNQVLGPCLDLTRDPRNGRGPESGGEDPYLAGSLGATFVRGIQSTGAIATAKHLAATNHQQGRREADHTIDARTLRELYGYPFRIVVQQGIWSVMNAYNWINGRPSSANPELLTRILRDEWGYPYYVVSDWGSIYGETALSLDAGCDLEMPHTPGLYPQKLPDAVANGTVSMEVLDEAVRRVLRTKAAAGLLGDGSLGDPSHICSEVHRDLVREVAHKSVVLLKNEGRILPLNEHELRSIALIGPSADVAQLDGQGSSVVQPCYTVTPKQGIEHRAPGVTVHYAKGCDIHSDDRSGFPAAIAAAQKADVVIFVGGLDDTQEGEELDRVGGSVELPALQQELIVELAAVNPNLIVVLESGGIVSLERSIEEVKGLLYAFYPGQEGGNAIADVLFGDVNPSGKLPVTMPRHDDQLPDWEDLDFTDDVVDGFGYRRFDHVGMQPRYAFGHGLSYTTFEVGNLVVTPTATSEEVSVVASVDVTNTGPVAGSEVVQLYLSAEFADPTVRQAVPMPVKQLRGFQRVTLAPGQSATVAFALGPDELAFWSVSDDSFRVEAGTYTLWVGNASDHLNLSSTFRLASSLLYDSTTGKTVPAPLPVLANVARGRPARCSSIEDLAYGCDKAVDGELTTRWSSQFSDPQWIQVDLGVRQQIERVILHWEMAYGRGYQVQVSDDASNWRDVYSTTAGDGAVDNLDLSAAGRYVRVHIADRGTMWGDSLWEFEVYGGDPTQLDLFLPMR
jgi:beta-glucosidase